MSSTGPLVQGCAGLVRQCSTPYSRQMRSKRCPPGRNWCACGLKRYPVVRPSGVPFTRQFIAYTAQKFGRNDPFGPRVKFGKRPFASAVDGPAEVLLAFFGLDFGKIDGQVAHRIIFEFLFRWALPVFAQRQAADAVALETAGQRRAREVRNARLQRVETVIKRQQEVRKAPAMASCSRLRTVETGTGPMRASRTVGRLRHLATIFGWML